MALPKKTKGKNLVYLTPIAKEEKKIKVLENKIKRSERKEESLKKESDILTGKQKERKELIKLKKIKIDAIQKSNEEEKRNQNPEIEVKKKEEKLKEIDSM